VGANVDHIRSYYEALNSGDAARVASHFTEDATHYYTRLEPHRGAEWFLFRDGKIAEIRAYYHSGPKNRQGNLLGFDHAGRGHRTLDT